MGLGMRSALLPDSTVVVEIGDSWRHLETIAVLGVWAVAGLLVAPVVLRRMARRESGSNVACSTARRRGPPTPATSGSRPAHSVGRLKHIRVERLEYTARGLSADLDEESSWIPTGTAKPIEVQS
jgi:hypothetical protein